MIVTPVRCNHGRQHGETLARASWKYGNNRSLTLSNCLHGFLLTESEASVRFIECLPETFVGVCTHSRLTSGLNHLFGSNMLMFVPATSSMVFPQIQYAYLRH